MRRSDALNAKHVSRRSMPMVSVQGQEAGCGAENRAKALLLAEAQRFRETAVKRRYKTFAGSSHIS